jgi:1-(5-phosphoribosyl)-5-[(5-phosphoribosylamino)methylideneamino] imidazole-4-carboxamide isomerase/N-(5'phosphoribosyl)anthranilate isomerase
MAPNPEKPMFTLLPAVDVQDGRAVRLVKGAAGTETDYGDPVAAARAWVDQGAPWLHVVDLDAAFGRGDNRSVIADVVRSVANDVPVEVSGGLRDDAALDAALATGATRAVLGTAALENPDWVASAIARYGDRVAIALDVRGDRLAARGWVQEGGLLDETLARLNSEGASRFIVTDVERDGTMNGPNLHLLKHVLKATSQPVIASGGVARLEDLHKLTELVSHGLEGVIVGRALYDGAFTLAEAIAAIEPRFDLYFWGPPQP